MNLRLLSRLMQNRLTLFALLTIVFCAEYIGLGPFSFMRMYDVGDSFITRYLVLKDTLFQYGITYWFPHMACGVDRVSQDLLHLHVVEFLFVLLPGWLAYQVTVFLQFFLSGYFTYRIGKDHLELSEESSIFAGCSFALFRVTDINYQLGYALIPFVLWSVDAIYERCSTRRYGWLWIILLGIAYSSASSVVWSLPFALVMVPVWFALVRRKWNPRFWIYLCLFLVVAIVCQLPSVYAVASNAGLSHRVSWPTDIATGQIFRETFGIFAHPLNRFEHRLFLPLILIAAVLSRLRDRHLNSLLFLLLLTVIGTVAPRLVQNFLPDKVAFLRGFQFQRFFHLAHLLFPLCAVYAFERMPRNPIFARRGLESVSIRAIVLAVSAGVVLFDIVNFKIDHIGRWRGRGNYVSNFGSEHMERLSKQQDSDGPFRVTTLSSAWERLQPGYANAYGLESADGYANLYSRRYQHFWMEVIEPTVGKFGPGFYENVRTWGNRLYLFMPETDPETRTQQKWRFEDYYRLNLLSLANTRYIISPWDIALVDENLAPFVTALDRNSMSRWDRRLLRFRELFVSGNDLFIYENRSCLPRFFIAGSIKTFQTPDELLDAMSLAKVDTLRHTVYLEEPFAEGFDRNKLGVDASEIRVVRYSPDAIQLALNVVGAGILVVSNSYSPYWKVRVNGIEGRIVPAYHTFWGVFVDDRAKEVLFYYDPPYRPL